eukprot:TRINITY_DN122_c0_g2_i1.p1 TRINITY_DN122_c0_g2~~TRINITY_DN122_c0_g2_i1.p1  ORF type:complete len:371 (+),score=124.60 TRINITY_DN122_c0_g2_i1:66-1178(+)
MLESIRYSEGHLEIVDQLQLPGKFEYAQLHNSKDGWEAIRSMKVRGAPAIAITAALSLAVEVKQKLGTFGTVNEAADFLIQSWTYLKTSRPTAVNLFQAADFFIGESEEAKKKNGAGGKDEADKFLQRYLSQAKEMLEKDVAANKAIGKYGAECIQKYYEKKNSSNNQFKILTHCNTGSLATAGYGTALGVIRALQEQSKLEHAYCTETRPYNQGARLTALELVHEKISATLVTDSMVGFLFSQKGVSAVVVGADRVVANGDTANKIGTYSIAILCQYHKIPFYVAAPTTTLDVKIEDGSKIHIEERPAKELTHVHGIPLAADGIGVWNPSFDVTPAALIEAIITDVGVIYKDEKTQAFDVRGFLAQHQK